MYLYLIRVHLRCMQLWSVLCVSFAKMPVYFENGANVYAYRLPNAIRELEKKRGTARLWLAAFIDE